MPPVAEHAKNTVGLFGGQEPLTRVLQNYVHVPCCPHVLQVHLPGSLTHDPRRMSTPRVHVFSHDGVPAIQPRDGEKQQRPEAGRSKEQAEGGYIFLAR